MFVSILLLIPWIIFGFNSVQKFIGLNQTRTSIITLLVVEIIYFCILIKFLNKPNSEIAGRGSFAWQYMFLYEKGIFPLQGIAETINGHWGDKIDRHYKFLYLLTALVMDYIILWIISPWRIKSFKE